MALTWLAADGDGGAAIEPGLIPVHLVNARVSHPVSLALRMGRAARMPIGCGTYMPGYVE
jgi:hypothetical protein